MFQYKDQLGRTIRLEHYLPKRIVSLVPSQTELLYDLGLEDEVVGITKFCVHPQHWFRNKTRVGGTKNVNIEKARSLQPDLIIANKEENVKEQIEALEQIAPVWISDVSTFDDALQMIESIGEITRTSEKAKTLITRINTNFNNLKTENSKLSTVNCQLSTAYLIWRHPFMTVGGDTFISDMLCKCGLQNVFKNETRYPEITLDELKLCNPGLILLSSEPYPFKQKHITEIQSVLSNSKLMLVNGEMFSWYGSRMLYVAKYFSDLLKKLKA